MRSTPPLAASRLLRRIVSPARGDEMLRDLEEDYRDRVGRGSRIGADIWYWSLVSRPALWRFGLEAREVRTLRLGSRKSPGIVEPAIRWLEQTARDVRHAGRRLRNDLTFTIAAGLTLGLGIGATTAVYSVVHGVLLSPLPYPEPDRLVRVFNRNQANQWNVSVAGFQGIEASQRTFSHVAAASGGQATLLDRRGPALVDATWVTADFFRTLGVDPAEGRGFRPGEDRPGAPSTAVIGQAFRDRWLGPGTDALGRALTLDGRSYEVVGVLPASRDELAGLHADVWPILQLDTPNRRGPFFLRVFGRLRADASLEEARVDLDAVSERIFPQWAEGFSDRTARLTPVPLREVIVGDVSDTLLMLLAAVAGVLLIGIANVANLVLVRATGRDREMALRTALGATRRRLVRQLVIESLLLAAIGGAAGLGIAWLGLRTLVATSPGLPRLSEIGLDGGVLRFTALVTIGAGLLFGLAPLLQGGPRHLSNRLRGSGRGSSAAGRWTLVRSALVTAEFALAFPLLVGTGLLLGTFLNLQSVDVGYDPHGLISARLSLPQTDYAGYDGVIGFVDEALRSVEAIPGVLAVGVSTGLPPDLHGDSNNFDLVDRPVPPGTNEHVAPWTWVSPGFLETLDVPLLEGRMLEESDGRGDRPPVILVSRGWAERYYPGESAIGKRVYAGGDHENPMTVVGVVGDVKYGGLDARDDAAVYEPTTQAGFRRNYLLVRTTGDPGAIVERVTDAIHDIDPGLPVSNVETMTDRLSAAVATPRYWTTLIALFAAVGLVLAAIGTYGVVSYFVERQTREIGIRIAIGAAPGTVRRWVLGRGMVRAGIGIGIGAAASLALTRWLESLLFGMSPTDLRALAAAAASLAAVALLACWVPARRATRIDPVRTLSAE